MDQITKEQYEYAEARIEELLPLVDDSTPANDRNAVELSIVSDIVVAYEKEHYPIPGSRHSADPHARPMIEGTLCLGHEDHVKIE